MKIFRETKDVFVKPIKKYYFGRLMHGTPYFYPINFKKNIISIRKLEPKTKDELDKIPKHLKKYYGYEYKLPMVRRTKYWIVKLLNKAYYIEIGYPIKIHFTNLGWKTKWDDVRFEWCPQFSIFFFKWQFCIWCCSPDGNNDKYYEMMLHYLYKSDKNIKKAKETWRWIDCETNKSTWNDKYIK